MKPISNLWKILIGYVNIEMEGLGLNQCLNLAAKSGAKFSQVQRVSYTTVRAQASLAGYLKARQAVAMFEGRIQLKVLRAGGILKLADF